ncbi:hypothetical protein [Schlesneria paludicola]|uniref:hypothetical protein n=1 Tax=Schlesneria paludicola TaxID=360056 RepID=UPI00029A91ED|nr:hypothetical protein [Schlesneria paludicola]
MAEEKPLNDDLGSFAAALSDLAPRPMEINRDRLMYDICHAQSVELAADPNLSLWLWKCATSVSTMTAAVFAGLWFTASGSPVVPGDHVSRGPGSVGESTVTLSDEPLQGIDLRSSVSPSASVVSVPYIHQRNRLLAEGLEDGSLFLVPDRTGAIVAPTNQQIRDLILDPRELGG